MEKFAQEGSKQRLRSVCVGSQSKCLADNLITEETAIFCGSGCRVIFKHSLRQTPPKNLKLARTRKWLEMNIALHSNV